MTERERILANMTAADRIIISPLSEARARVVKDIETKLGRALTDAEIAGRLEINLKRGAAGQDQHDLAGAATGLAGPQVLPECPDSVPEQRNADVRGCRPACTSLTLPPASLKRCSTCYRAGALPLRPRWPRLAPVPRRLPANWVSASRPTPRVPGPSGDVVRSPCDTRIRLLSLSEG